MTRREFLKACLAAGAVLTCPINLKTATAEQVEESLEFITENCLYVRVGEMGTVYPGDFESDPSRRALFKIEDLNTRDDLAEAMDSFSPPRSFMSHLYDSHRKAELQKIHSQLKALRRKPESTEAPALLERKALLEESSGDEWYGWVDQSSDELFAKIQAQVEHWLDETVEAEDWECSGSNPEAEIGWEIDSMLTTEQCEALSLKGYDSSGPGNDFSGYVLDIGIDEANAIAEAQGIPIRFLGYA